MDTAAIPGIYILYPIDICICNPPLIHLSDFNSLITCSTEGKLQKAAHSSQAWWENHISDSLYLAYICLIFLIMCFFFLVSFSGASFNLNRYLCSNVHPLVQIQILLSWKKPFRTPKQSCFNTSEDQGFKHLANTFLFCLPTIFQSQFQPVKLWSSNLNQAALLENWTGILDCATHLA